MDLEVILNAGIPEAEGLWKYVDCGVIHIIYEMEKEEGEMGFYLNIYYATQQRDDFQLEFAIASIQIFCLQNDSLNS